MDLPRPTGSRRSCFQSAAIVKAGVVVAPKQVSLPTFSRSRGMEIAAFTSSIARATYPAGRASGVSKLLLTHRRQLCSRFLRDAYLLVATKHRSGIFPKRANGTFVVASLPVAGPESVQIASILFTLGTTFVIPYYTIMILAPHAVWTRKLVESSIPYVILGIFYVYLLALSWTSETLHLMFASKYWLPELPGITKMFSSTITVASAWIHLLALDLFAARQVFLDGQQHAVETRHSLVLCLLVCPIGILSHLMTKAAMQFLRRENNGKTIG